VAAGASSRITELLRSPPSSARLNDVMVKTIGDHRGDLAEDRRRAHGAKTA